MRVAILGVSNIARNSAKAMIEAGMQIIAVLSRDIAKAEAFKVELGAMKAYDDYELLLEDEDIDTVYVGLPNSLHHEYAKKALMHKKNVLLEKPFTLRYSEALELKNLAVARHLYLFETITTLYQPLLADLHEDIAKIMPLHSVILNFSKYSAKYDEFLEGKLPNVFDEKMGGGAFYDLNIYNLHLAYDLFGRPKKAVYEANYQRAIDTSGVMTLSYQGFFVSAIAGKDAQSKPFALFSGEKGYIYLDGAPSIIKGYELHLKDQEPIVKKDDTNAYTNEFKVMERIFKKGLYKTHLDVLERSLQVMKVADELLSK